MKKWYLSKTLWVNVLVLLGVGAQIAFKVDVSAEAQAAFISVVNILLRVYTNLKLTK